MFPHESACAPGPSSDVGVVSPVCGPNSSLSVGEDAAIKALLSASLGARLDFGDEWTEGCEDMQGGIPRARHGSMLERRGPLDASPMQSPYTNGHPLQAWQQTGMDGLGNAEWNASSSLASSIVASAPYSAPRGSTTVGKRNLASSRGRAIAPPREDRPAAAAAAAMASMGVRKNNTKRARCAPHALSRASPTLGPPPLRPPFCHLCPAIRRMSTPRLAFGRLSAHIITLVIACRLADMTMTSRSWWCGRRCDALRAPASNLPARVTRASSRARFEGRTSPSPSRSPP